MQSIAGRAYSEIMQAADQNRAASFVANLTKRESEAYDYGAALQIIRGVQGGAQLGGFEREVSEELRRVHSLTETTHNSIFVPLPGTLPHRRDQTAASAPGGGYLVSTNVGEAIPYRRSRSVLRAFGAQRLEGLQGSLGLPKINTGASTTWHTNEATQSAEQSPILGMAVLTPKTVSSFVETSNQLLKQSNAGAVFERDLADALDAAVDAAGISGSGAAGQPLGLTGTAGVKVVTGTSIAWSGVLDFIVNAGDANEDVTGWAMPPAIYKLLANREKFTGAGAILKDQAIDMRPARHSTAVPAATLIAGPWDEIFIGVWSVVELTFDKYTKFTQQIVGLRAIFSVDVACRYPAAFTKAETIT